MARSRAWALASFTSLALLVSSARGASLQGYTATGQLGMEVEGYSSFVGALPFLSGTFNVSQIPIGATVQKAFVYTGDWNNSGVPLDLKFGVSTNIPALPNNNDITGFFSLYGYRWDVTAFVVNANMSYNFTIGLDQLGNAQGNQIPAAALAVVWSDPTALSSTVAFVDGALQVGENTPTVTDTESMTFSGLPAGSTALNLFTISDDATGTGEVIKYNSLPVGGPIDANLGQGGSVISIGNIASQSPANNVVSVTSSADHFGWIFSAVLVPEPGTATLISLAIPLLAFAAWRRARRRG
jgi:hypothetical protein